jgi:hypothetical protein
MSTELTTHQKAEILVNDIEAALAAGTRHYNHANELLPTPLAVVATLLNEGEVRLEPAPTPEVQ